MVNQEQGTRGWQLLPELERGDHDTIVTKTACDSLYESMLPQILDSLNAKRLTNGSINTKIGSTSADNWITSSQ
jgi:Isochorismatase family